LCVPSGADANEALLLEFFERGLAELKELAKTDPDQARALAQATIERLREATRVASILLNLPSRS